VVIKIKLPEHSSTDIPEARHGKESRYFFFIQQESI
jgi:hypothetical protein